MITKQFTLAPVRNRNLSMFLIQEALNLFHRRTDTELDCISICTFSLTQNFQSLANFSRTDVCFLDQVILSRGRI